MHKLLGYSLMAVTGAMLWPVTTEAQQAPSHPDAIREWSVEWGGRSRDPYVAPDGKVWFVGQAGNYIAWFDPSTEDMRRYEIEDGTNPHNLIVDEDGYVWYAGNRNGRIGRLDPETGEADIHMTGEARDPHTLIFDGKGNIWFTSQQSNYIGRLTMASGEVEIREAFDTPSRPYGIVQDAEGHLWVALFNTNRLVRVDPQSFEFTYFTEADEASRSRRIEWTSDNKVWYVDEPRGFLGRIDPATGEVTQWQMPGGPDSRPYALTKDDRGILWVSETGPVKQLVAFDPATERFISVNPVSHNIRHMMFDSRTGAMWFGTDANNVGRVMTRQVNP